MKGRTNPAKENGKETLHLMVPQKFFKNVYTQKRTDF
jgi:hypothetical protein